jgi:uncharacterized protein YdiU (UPF0061 family)
MAKLTYNKLPNYLFKVMEPYNTKKRKVEIFNNELAQELGLEKPVEEYIESLLGNKYFEGLPFISQAYSGHQYGHFTNLGDGRAVLLGEFGEHGLDVQLKGSGPTPFSRSGDGKATLDAMIREYIISESMFGLGIPTTRTLSVISTEEVIQRETEHIGAVLSRVANSHIRVGTFEFAARNGTDSEFREFVDYSMNRLFPQLENGDYLGFLRAVITEQAKLIAKWQSVGFIHGVMNTDNMTISGETIDYGPCAFMDTYNELTVFSSIDRTGRYAYVNQPKIAAWNLSRFAETLIGLLDESSDEAIRLATMQIEYFVELFNEEYLSLMSKKLGMKETNEELVRELLNLMQVNGLDYTNTFVALTLREESGLIAISPQFNDWVSKWMLNLDDDSTELMKSVNPCVVPRNYYVEEAIAEGVMDDYSKMNHLLRMMKNPFEYSSEQLEFVQREIPEVQGYKTYCGT